MAALVGLLVLANRSTALAPDFLAEFVLYALVATDLTIVLALVFVLTRNIVKLVVEQRRPLPFARFRAKLVAVLLVMTLVPALLARHPEPDDRPALPGEARHRGTGPAV